MSAHRWIGWKALPRQEIEINFARGREPIQQSRRPGRIRPRIGRSAGNQRVKEINLFARAEVNRDNRLVVHGVSTPAYVDRRNRAVQKIQFQRPRAVNRAEQEVDPALSAPAYVERLEISASRLSSLAARTAVNRAKSEVVPAVSPPRTSNGSEYRPRRTP